MLSLKVAFISTGVLCMVVMFKLSAPAIAEFSFSEVTAIWSSLISWLRPPYLYAVINCIILTLVASSKLQHKNQYKSPPETVVQGAPVSVSADYGAVYDGVVRLNEQPEIAYRYGAIAARGSEYKSKPETVVQAEPVKVSSDYSVVYGGTVPVDDQPEISYGYDAIAARGPEYKSPRKTVVQEAPVNFSADYGVVYGGVVPVGDQTEIVDGYYRVAARDFDVDADVHVDAQVPEIEIKTITLATPFPEDESKMAKPSRTPQRNSKEYSLWPAEKPPVSVRFGQRRTAKSTPEGGGTLRASKPKRQETLESTWKTITEGRHMPLTRHLSKSDTWEMHGRGGHQQLQDHCMTKSQTFVAPAGSAVSPPLAAAAGGKLRREPSLSEKLRRDPSPSQDELNSRVEAFIRKFNEDMRLQRQESLNQYMEMINRGAH